MPEGYRGRGLAVVVVNYGSSTLLRANLVQVQSELPEALLVVVDNATSDDERTAVRDLGAEHGWTVLEPVANLGFGGGMNLGVAAAIGDPRTETLLLLNPDASIDAENTEVLVTAALQSPHSLLGPEIRRPDGRVWSRGHVLDVDTGRMRRLDDQTLSRTDRPWLTGACLVMSVELWRAVGGFDEEYFLYWEDVDLSHRVLALGGAVRFEPRAVAIHDEGGTHVAGRVGGDRAKSTTYYYYNIVNRFRYASGHLDAAGMRSWSRSAWSASWEILLRGGKRQFLRSPKPILAGARGFLAGRRLLKLALARTGPYVESVTADQSGPSQEVEQQ